MKSLWQILNEQRADTGVRSSKPGYWTPERKEILKKAYESNKSNKEIVRDHFPELSLHAVANALRTHGPKLGLKLRNPSDYRNRETSAYWTSDRKYLLKRSWNARAGYEAIQADHFPELSIDQLRHGVEKHREELGLKTFKTGPKSLTPAPLDDEARERITADLKKPKANIRAIANRHYASPSAVMRLKRSINGDKQNAAPPAIIPQEHIDFAKKARQGQVDISPDMGRNSIIGQRRLARAMREKFPGSTYNTTQVRHLVHNGTFGLDGEEPIRPHKNPVQMARRKSIWQSHLAGQSHDVIAKAHGIRPNVVSKLVKKYTVAHERLLGHKPAVNGQMSESTESKMKHMVAANDDRDNKSQLDHWHNEVLHHEHKAAHHRRLYDMTPDHSEFKSIHKKAWDHHEGALARARFMHRKYQILSGEA